MAHETYYEIQKKYRGEEFSESMIRGDWQKYNAYVTLNKYADLSLYNPNKDPDYETFQNEQKDIFWSLFINNKMYFEDTLRDQLNNILGSSLRFYEILGFDWDTTNAYRDEIDFSVIGEEIYQGVKNLDLEMLQTIHQKYCREYWAELVNELPKDRFYAASEVQPLKRVPKQWPKWSFYSTPRYTRLKGVLRNTYRNLVPAAGNFYYFDTEEERDAFVASQKEPNTIPIHFEDMPEMQWRLNDAKRVPKKTAVNTETAYMVIDQNKWFEVYETKELAEEAIELSQHQHYLSIVEIPYIRAKT